MQCALNEASCCMSGLASKEAKRCKWSQNQLVDVAVSFFRRRDVGIARGVYMFNIVSVTCKSKTWCF